MDRCTRWFIPLLILPIPTAPPFFLILFLFSLTLHARPCFYCVTLLTSLFVSSCYWQPIPLHASLAEPWSENITTFSDALSSLFPRPLTDKEQSSILRMSDRCWCDLTSTKLFEPFNTTQWELLSVAQLGVELARSELAALQAIAGNMTSVNGQWHEVNGTRLPIAEVDAKRIEKADKGSTKQAYYRSTQEESPSTAKRADEGISAPSSSSASATSSSPVTAPQDLPLIRREYDFRPLGVDMVVDFGWSR
ncbi:hypothetical protein EWM64_g10523 [Hericium alpestre]|uniref:Uncharacterized protein n=1 Tax=Hericium alpestre TaxID=135208 RepID=A0A4Y9ZJ58_9AGAM|nr:hypothetical protein EWM64_g10523 [Hericium alpestre]